MTCCNSQSIFLEDRKKTSTRRRRLGCTIFFSHFIYHFTDYDKQGLAAYKSFENYNFIVTINCSVE